MLPVGKSPSDSVPRTREGGDKDGGSAWDGH